MTLTNEMTQAFQLIEETGENLYITGKAGTGKTTLLKYIVKNTHKRIVVAASTGIAAINAGGATLHSLFNIPLTVQSPNEQMKGRFHPDKVELYQRIDTLIIDEISMVRPDTIDYIDRKLRLYRMSEKPFGGIQVVMFGDLYQLPPVIKKEEKDILLMFYRGVYFFYAHVFLKYGFRVIELNTVFRQSNSRFVEILNHIRSYKMTPRDIEDLDTLRDRRESHNFSNEHIHICAFKKDVQKINSELLGEATFQSGATYIGDFPKNAAPCDIVLSLRVGARVMMIVNDPNHLYYNGSLGVVTSIEPGVIGVHLDSGYDIKATLYEWKAKEYQVVEDKIETVDKGSCTQYPLTLAWAITIHKSQGLTFDKVSIHANNIFAPGQLYVALSRCRSMEGIITESFINNRHIIPDRELVAFEQAYKANKNIFNRDTYRSMKIK